MHMVDENVVKHKDMIYTRLCCRHLPAEHDIPDIDMISSVGSATGIYKQEHMRYPEDVAHKGSAPAAFGYYSYKHADTSFNKVEGLYSEEKAD